MYPAVYYFSLEIIWPKNRNRYQNLIDCTALPHTTGQPADRLPQLLDGLRHVFHRLHVHRHIFHRLNVHQAPFLLEDWAQSPRLDLLKHSYANNAIQQLLVLYANLLL